MKIRYFAWLRERVGHGEETIELSSHLKTAADLVAWLSKRGDNYAAAFEVPELVQVAVDQERADMTTPLYGAREVAFFPPMTGG